MKERWGYMLDRFHNQGRTAHLLRGDNGPRCGTRYYASAGASTDVPEEKKCFNCKQIAKRLVRSAALKAEAVAKEAEK
jgi:hypothetical protein